MEFDVEIGIGLIFGFIVIGPLLIGKLPLAPGSKFFKEMGEELRDSNNPLAKGRMPRGSGALPDIGPRAASLLCRR